MEKEYGHDDKEQEKRVPSGMNIVFGILMIVVYWGMAYLLLFTTLFANLYDIVRYVMGAVFALYGLFRGYRLFMGMK